jgi:hypothetical protein
LSRSSYLRVSSSTSYWNRNIFPAI